MIGSEASSPAVDRGPLTLSDMLPVQGSGDYSAMRGFIVHREGLGTLHIKKRGQIFYFHNHTEIGWKECDTYGFVCRVWLSSEKGNYNEGVYIRLAADYRHYALFIAFRVMI
ncbi:LOW QUALITY PROTEIN: hypothetical protein M8C21_021790 [Ambrosia artemisiifolia]|uniref:Uncharacterized protein n=1 Tax=Ambrosia artemisiifolia TaxID=4212 RepID=A0AAD5GD02_AMBAR|nr:LOW QUALITY PROTEIN: hypothetical protein M8C21_021790 [Ambrosia artemisiifolia]